MAALHLATNGQFGFHRDELQFLDDARHLAWGYVAYPPFTPAVERLAWLLFGPSLRGLRLFSVLAQAGVMVFAGLIAAELGGRRFAQLAAALAVAVSPVPMFEATEFQYTSFELLWWVLLAWCLLRLLRSGDERWWIAAGTVAGLFLMTKYTAVFVLVGLATGLALTPTRRYFRSRWLWMGTAVAFALCLPNLLWQLHHGFVSLAFLRHIHLRDMDEGRAQGFWLDQFRINAQPLAAPLWLAGVVFFFTRPGRRYRILAWMALVPIAIMALAHGRGYYTAGAYPILLAAGCVLWAGWIESWPRGRGLAAQAATAIILIVGGLWIVPKIVPLGRLSATNPTLEASGDAREEVGWRELVAQIARVRDTLPAEQRSRAAVETFNYGETGAVDLYGPFYGLPSAISRTNSAWYRGFGAPAPSLEIILGVSARYAERRFENCRVAARNGNRYGIHNEEADNHPDILVCGPPRSGWPAFWSHGIAFG